jgi:CubicO group peptidase (beta-lactamase class C family)
MTAIEGSCETRFRAVREAFERNFHDLDELGSAVSVTLDGKTVVDLWGGHADPARTRAWRRDTIVALLSVTKQVTALCLHMLIDRGRVDLDAPVARYWPEFAQAGKAGVLIRHLLDHRAGVPVLDRAWPGIAYDWDAMSAALAAQAPLWEPGSVPCYHTTAYGHLLGEVIRRVSGKTPGRFLREEIAGPLGLDLHIGLQPDAEARCAQFIRSTDHAMLRQAADDASSLFARAWSVFARDEDLNSPDWRRREIPCCNGHGNARALARLCGALARGGELDGVRLLSESALRRASVEQWEGRERVGRYHRYSLGFPLNCPGETPMGPNREAFGFLGAGAATAIVDPAARIGFAYTPNKMDTALGLGQRVTRLIDATFAAVY